MSSTAHYVLDKLWPLPSQVVLMPDFFTKAFIGVEFTWLQSSGAKRGIIVLFMDNVCF